MLNDEDVILPTRELVLSWARRVHPVVGVPVTPTPVNVATPEPFAVTVSVPLNPQDPLATLSVMESVAAGNNVTTTAGEKALPDWVLVGCVVNDWDGVVMLNVLLVTSEYAALLEL